MTLEPGFIKISHNNQEKMPVIVWVQPKIMTRHAWIQ